jgi:ATP-dependent exoDNAse (exonuclease V) alpha subunit
MVTPEMQATEKQILTHIKDNATSQQAIYTSDIAKQVVDNKYTSLSDNQKEFVAGCLSSTAQVILVQGFSGSGKTYAAAKLVEEVKLNGYSVRAFGPTAAAARELGNSTGLKGETLAKFFMSDSATNGHDKGKEIWLVDEASMVGSLDMMQLISRATDPNVEARVILIGDRNQLQSVSAGRIFSDLQKSGVTDTLQLTDIKRQTSEHMVDAAGKIRDIGQVVDALKIVEQRGQLHEIKDFQERVNVISEQYVNSNPEKTMLVVSTNSERNELNRTIHEKLQEQGKISAENVSITIKESKSLDAVEKHFSSSYQVGDIVQAGKSGGGLTSGYSGRVTGVDTETNTFTLTDSKGIEKAFDPMQHADSVNVYRERDIVISEGDKVVFLKNDEGERGIGVVNGDAGIVKSVDQSGYMTVELAKGKETTEISFNLGQYNNIDLAHAITSYKSQGSSIEHVVTDKHRPY